MRMVNIQGEAKDMDSEVEVDIMDNLDRMIEMEIEVLDKSIQLETYPLFMAKVIQCPIPT